MRINGPTTRYVNLSGVDRAPKAQLPGATGQWDFGLTEFPERSEFKPPELSPRPRAVVEAQPRVSGEITANLAAELLQEFPLSENGVADR